MKVRVFKIRISDEFLSSDQSEINHFLGQYNILSTNSNLIEDEMSYWSVLVSYQEHKVKETSNKTISVLDEELSEEEKIIYNKLKNWRAEKARESQLPAYIIFHNNHLMSIAKHKPCNLEDLENVNGIGKSKVEKFGMEIIDVLENA